MIGSWNHLSLALAVILPVSGRVAAAQSVAMDGPVCVGIGFCAHNADGLASATFSNVKIEQAGRQDSWKC